MLLILHWNKIKIKRVKSRETSKIDRQTKGTNQPEYNSTIHVKKIDKKGFDDEKNLLKDVKK